MNGNTPMTLLGEKTHIDVRAIERELNKLWHSAATSEGEEARNTVTRTCVLNLIVLTGSSRTAQRATDTISQLTQQHPNRALMIRAVPDAPEPLLDAWVQAHCRMPGSGRQQVCCEQITIEARGTAVPYVPGTILPLLVPDVPVMLWWPGGEPFDHPLFARLSAFADRVIVDTATFAKPEAGLARLAGLNGGDMAISDLVWARLTPWREMVAQFFDAPAMLPHLNEIKGVTVDYEAQPGTMIDRTQALLLIGWLGSRLGWRAAGAASERDGNTQFLMQRKDGGAIQMLLRPTAPVDDALDKLTGLTLECQRARFEITRDESPNAAVARSDVEGMQPLRRVVRLEQLDEAGLIAEELRLLGRDHAFEGALHTAATLAVTA
jgi:glucose-6-phosphate dehydrogenase assembly protein OpcA